VSNGKQQQWCSGKKKGGKENKIKRKTRERHAAPRSCVTPRKLGWAALGEKERKSGLHMRV
jgi:hypothetical protein